MTALNERLARVRDDLSDFLSADDTTFTPGEEALRRRLIRLEYHLSAYLGSKGS
ncbi:MAG TPA: hypothetical protein VJB88_15640 [Vicinamibacteria bacterium]|nr:hypothetical protein [Vicinamibacteria bacterium]